MAPDNKGALLNIHYYYYYYYYYYPQILVQTEVPRSHRHILTIEAYLLPEEEDDINLVDCFL